MTRWQDLYPPAPEPAASGRPVRVRGVVLCFDRDWGQFYVHDGTLAQYLDPQFFSGQPDPETGAEVEIAATTRSTAEGSELVAPRLRILGRGLIPPAEPLRLSALTNAQGRWVEITGTVRGADTSRGHLSMVLHEGQTPCVVDVLGASASYPVKALRGAEVRVRGIDGSRVVNGRSHAFLIAPGTNDLTVLKWRRDTSDTPVTSIDGLLNRPLGDWTNHLVHVSGVISAYQPAESLTIRDPTGTIRAEISQVTPAEIDERVQVWGYFTVRTNEVLLADAYFAFTEPPPDPAPVAASATPALQPPLPTSPLTEIPALATLSRDQLALRLPVRLRGVLTYADPGFQNAFLQAGDSAIYVDLHQENVRAGEEVEIRGVTHLGGYAPYIAEATAVSLGFRGLPPPRYVSLDEVADGRLDSHFLEMEAVVRRAHTEWGRLYLHLGARRGKFQAIVPGVTNADAGTKLIGRMVRIRGACASLVNALGQLTGIKLHVPALDQITALDPATDDPFARAATPISGISTYNATSLGHGTSKVAGVVTLFLAPSSCYLQDGTGGLFLALQETNLLQAGENIEAVGFPTLGDFSPRLEEVEVRRLGQSALPPPRRVTAEDILVQGRCDGLRVELTAHLVQRVNASARPRLVLQDGATMFTAHVVGGSTDTRLSDLQVGSQLRLTGVCAVQGGHTSQPESFRLLLAQASDVHLLQGPPWWSVRHTLVVAGSLATAVLLALTWVRSLRRQVRTQTRVIAQQLAEVKAFSESLDRERTLLATLIDQLPDHVFVLDRAGNLLLSNRAYDRFHGLQTTHGPVHGDRPMAPTTPPPTPGAMTAEDRRVLEDGISQIDFEETRKGAEGVERWFSVSKVPLKDGTGAIIGLVGIRHDVTDRKRAEAELAEMHKQLLSASHQAGMAEVATSVLHNVGNVLNSINVSAGWVMDRTRNSKIAQIGRVADLLAEHATDLARFFQEDPMGRRVPEYLRQLAEHLATERDDTVRELESLVRNVTHVKAIVARQQSHARMGGVVETVPLAELIDDALRMISIDPEGPRVPIVRDYRDDSLPTLAVDRHKALQILVNLVSNAIQACDASGRSDPQIRIRVTLPESRVRIAVEDNGVGITPENRKRLFQHGFTTRPGGHGFGLHNAALAARNMDGEVHAFSDGPGQGATFTLDLPLASDESPAAQGPPQPGPNPAA